MSANGADAASIRLPPLYGRLEPLNPAAHAGLRMRDVGLGFAATLAAVPVALEEFGPAGRHMAVVFASEAPHMPVAVCSLQANTNGFIRDGAWRKGAYTPSYLRRYPFFPVRVSERSDEMALCLDPGAPQFSREEGKELFDAAGKPTEAARFALDFARSVEMAFVRTREMAQGLAALGLLAAASIEFKQDGQSRRIDGFHAVQRDKLHALPPAKLAELRDKGWLEPVYAHLLSLAGIPELAVEEPRA